MGMNMATTLQILDKRLEEDQDGSHRPHLGASSIGQNCTRKTWYSFRWALRPNFNADTLRRFRDGHESEELIARELSEVVELSGRQVRFQSGHFGGSVDGLILSGLVEAPDTPHIWEHKCTGKDKWDALQRMMERHTTALGHHNEVLLKWNRQYYEQAQTYMYKIGFEWHYMTVASAGSRDLLAFRTKLDPIFAREISDKAERIIESRSAPAKVSEFVDAFDCRFCDFSGVCHGNVSPDVSCRTCRYSSALADGRWCCDLTHHHLSDDEQKAACSDYCRFLDD